MKSSTPSQLRALPRSGDLPRRLGKGLLAVSATTSLLAMPAAASASVRPAPATASGAALCNGVSAGQVSGLVGFTVPGPTASTSHNTGTYKGYNMSGTTTTCQYGQPSSAAAISHQVIIFYETLSSAPPQSLVLSDLKAELKKTLSKVPNSKFTYNVSSSNGVVTLYMSASAGYSGFSFNLEALYNWKGTKVAGAVVYSKLAKSKLQALAQLAENNIGL